MKEIELTDSARKLEDIIDWLRQDNNNAEEGLRKVEEGQRLIKYSRDKLLELEDDFDSAEDEFKKKIA
jgi:hypothetical protein